MIRLLTYGKVPAALISDDFLQVPVLQGLGAVVIQLRLIGAVDNGDGDVGLNGQLLLIRAVVTPEFGG